MIIKFQILKSLVREAVQSATYLKGQIDRTTQNASNPVLQSETMGDDILHERTFTHDFDTALEILKTIFVDYIVPTPQTIGDNVIYYGDKTDDVIEFVLSVSRRYNGSLTDALARLSAIYIEDYILNQWWTKTTNLKQVEVYTAKLQVDEQNIRKCFILSSPIVPTVPYTTELTAKVDGAGVDGEVTTRLGDVNTLTYTLSEGALDDIEAHSYNPRIIEIHRCENRKAFILVPINTGFTKIKLFSRHSEDLSFECDILVMEREL